ncbi:hypothetical protein ACVWWK_006735 [Bradyrhizobium sp. LB9.1b]
MIVDLLVPIVLTVRAAALLGMGVAAAGVIGTGRGDDFLEVRDLWASAAAAALGLLHVRNQADGAGPVLPGGRVGRIVPAVVELRRVRRTIQRSRIDPLVEHVCLGRVLDACRATEAGQHRVGVLARIDAARLIRRHLLAARSGRIVDVPRRLLLELIDDLDHARCADAGIDGVGDELQAGCVVDRDRAGATFDRDSALGDTILSRRRDDFAVQIDVAARALHHAVHEDLVGERVVLDPDLDVACGLRRRGGRDVVIAAVPRVDLGLGKVRSRIAALEVVDGGQRGPADVDRVIAARAALDRAVDVDDPRRDDDRLAEDEGRVIGRLVPRGRGRAPVRGRVGLRGPRRDHVGLDIDDLEIGRAPRAIEWRVERRRVVGGGGGALGICRGRGVVVGRVAVDALAGIGIPLPRRGGDGLARRPFHLPEHGGAPNAAGVGVAATRRPRSHRQEDRRIERQAVVIQFQHARSEDRAVGGRLLNAVVAVDAAVVEIRVTGSPCDMRSGRVIAIGAEIGRRRHHRRQRVVVSRLEFDAGPLRENIVVGGVKAANAAEEDERAVGRHHLDGRGIE